MFLEIVVVKAIHLIARSTLIVMVMMIVIRMMIWMTAKYDGYDNDINIQ